VVNELGNDLVILPTNTPAVMPNGANPLPEITVGDRPMGLAVSPTLSRAYVYNLHSRDVSVIDLDNAVKIADIPVTPVTPVTPDKRSAHRS
jgi:DNA-binding beta-propeller fold protein YncE